MLNSIIREITVKILLLLLSLLFGIISVSFFFVAFYAYLNTFYSPLSSSVIVALTALLLSMSFLLVIKFKEEKSTAKSRILSYIPQNELNEAMTLVKRYPHALSLLGMLAGLILGSSGTLRSTFRSLSMNALRMEVTRSIIRRFL